MIGVRTVRGLISRNSAIGLLVAVVAIVIAGMPASASINAQTGASAGAPSTATITLQLSGDWPALYPWGANNVGTQILFATYDRLLATKNGKIVPYIATRWKTTPTQITFWLRKDVRCADGTPLTPADIATSLGYYYNNYPSAPSFYGTGMTVQAYNKQNKLVVHLKTPNADAVNWFAQPQSSLACRAGNANRAALANATAGSGPYIMESYVHGSQVVLVRRNDWTWGPEGTTWKDLPARIVMKVVANSTTSANLLLTNALDVGLVSGPDIARLKSANGLQAYPAPTYAAYRAYFNADPGHPTASQVVRRALMAALSPAGWNQAANFGLGQMTYSFLTKNTPCHFADAYKYYPRGGPQESKNIMRAGGYSLNADGKFVDRDGNPVTITVVAANTLFNAGPQLAISEYLKAGFNVIPQVTDAITASTRAKAGRFEVYFGTNPLVQPVPQAAMFFITGKNNFGHANSPTVDAAQIAALGAAGAARCPAWEKVQKLALEQAIAQPLPAPANVWYTRGVKIDPAIAYIEVWSIRPSN